MRDVVVAGGGPAGSVAAIALRKLDFDVEVVEKERFPRHHIGESLLSRTVPYLRALGVWDAVEAAGFVRKLGALFSWGRSSGLDVLDMPAPGYAYQVARDRFDELLLDAAREAGAAVVRGEVRNVVDGDDGVAVTVDTGGGVEERTARWLVDATGTHRLTARRSGVAMSRFDDPRCAVSAYVKGAARAGGGHEGRILTEASENGWLWFIPLGETTTSLGLVTDGEHVRTAASPETCLFDELPSAPHVSRLLQGSTVTGQVRLIRYTNYIADGTAWTGRTVRVGDAAMFVDPLFSTGVHGAVLSGYLAAACIGSVTNGEATIAAAREVYRAGLAEHFFRTRETVRLLYGSHRGRSRFWKAREIESMDADEARASVRMLGVAGTEIFRTLDATLYLPDSFVDELRRVTAPRPLQVLRPGDRVALSPTAVANERVVVSRLRLRAGYEVAQPDGYTAPVRAVRAGGQERLVGDLVAGRRDCRPTVLTSDHSLVLAGALVATGNADLAEGPAS